MKTRKLVAQARSARSETVNLELPVIFCNYKRKMLRPFSQSGSALEFIKNRSKRGNVIRTISMTMFMGTEQGIYVTVRKVRESEITDSSLDYVDLYMCKTNSSKR